MICTECELVDWFPYKDAVDFFVCNILKYALHFNIFCSPLAFPEIRKKKQ